MIRHGQKQFSHNERRLDLQNVASDTSIFAHDSVSRFSDNFNPFLTLKSHN